MATIAYCVLWLRSYGIRDTLVGLVLRALEYYKECYTCLGREAVYVGVQGGSNMGARWRRGCLLVMLTCCIVLCTVGSLAFVAIKTNRLRIAPPAELLDLGPIWIGDFCRDNVAHHRYPPGGC